MIIQDQFLTRAGHFQNYFEKKCFAIRVYYEQTLQTEYEFIIELIKKMFAFSINLK